MKNIDRIKKMDAKELTKFMNESTCNYCSYKNKDCGSEMCSIGIEEWLNQECESTIDDVYREFNKFCRGKVCETCNYPESTCEVNYMIDNFNIIDGKIIRRQNNNSSI